MPTSSSLTTLMTCWPGLRFWTSSRPIQRSRTASVNFRTTPISTSASSRAVRISRRTSTTSASLRRPRLRSLEKIPSNRSVRLSNMGPSGYRTEVGPTVAGVGCGNRVRNGRRSAIAQLMEWRKRRGGSETETRDHEGWRAGIDEVLDASSQPDQLDRKPELPLDGHHDPSLGRPVELGQHHARHIDGIEEHLGLGQAVLSGGGVEHQQNLDDVTGWTIGHPADLLQFLDEVDLVVKAAGRVGQDHRVPP